MEYSITTSTSITYSYLGYLVTLGILDHHEYFHSQDEFFHHYPSYHGWSLLRSGRAVQYRGLGYSNRFNTLQRLRTLPTLWSTDLVIPFGWTSIAPTKLVWPVTLPSYHRQSHSLLESSPGWPRALWHLPPSWLTTVPNGDAGKTTLLGSQGYRRLPDQGSMHA